MNILNLIGREEELFSEDIKQHEKELKKIVSNSSFLVTGAAGSIGQAVSKEIGLNAAPIAEDIAKRELTLPLYPTMTLDEVDLVCDSLKKALGK